METQPVLPVGRFAEPMKPITPPVNPIDRESLQLLGLSRIPRCAGCPRLEALLEVHATGTRLALPWPSAPEHCRHQVCVPFLRRYTATR